MIVLVVLIVIIFVVIGVAIWANTGSQVNLIDRLPNYRIKTLTDNSYIALTNLPITNPTDFYCDDCGPNCMTYKIGFPYWTAFVASGKTVTDNMGIWKIETVNDNSFTEKLNPGQKFVKIINTVYFDQTENSGTDPKKYYGYVGIDNRISPQSLLFTFTVSNNMELGNASIFIYTQMANNTFTLQLPSTPINRNVYINPETNLLSYNNGDIMPFATVFQLVTI